MIIKVEHEVPYDKGKELRCTYNDGDFWGESVCAYHTFRDSYHGKKAPVERGKPRCKLFNVWLDAPYRRCEACLKKCEEAAGGETHGSK